MKRIAFICLSLVLGLISCQAKAKSEAQPVAAQKTEQAAQPKAVVEHLTKQSFKAKVADYDTKSNEWKFVGDKPCIVDFYATWCGPCKTMSPLLQEVAEQFAGQINVYKVDVDKEPGLSQDFAVQSIPMLLFCPKEGMPQVATGAMPKEALVKAIEEILLGQKK